MASFDGKTVSKPKQESNPQAGPVDLRAARDLRRSSPRACVAFSALEIFDRISAMLSGLSRRMIFARANPDPQKDARPKVSLRSAKVLPFVVLKVFVPVLLFGSMPCLGGTIYNNLGPNNSFIINRDYDTNVTYMATSFTATDGGKLDSILAPLFSLTNPVTITLYEDANNQPGTLLESWAATLPGFPAQMLTLSSVLHPSMFAGAKYWLVITQSQPEEVAWYENDQGVAEGIWAGSSLNGMIQFLPASPMAALQVLSVDEPIKGCKSTYKSGTGPSFVQFCVTANGNVTLLQSPAGTAHFVMNDRAEGYGFCDLNRLESYFDYSAGGDSANWDAPVITQPNGPNTFPLEIARTTSDGAFTLTQSFSLGSTDRSADVSMSLTNNTGVGKKIYLLRFGHAVANATAAAANYYDLSSASGSAWTYDRLGSGVMLSALPTTVKHLGLIFATDGGPDPCNFLTTVVDPVAHPELFPVQGNASVGTVHSFSIPAGKSVTVSVGYRPF